MPMTKYEGQTLQKQTFVVEECCFINCVLKDCHLFYSGGDSEFLGGGMENCHWHFRGPALKTIQMAQSLGMLKMPQTPPPFPASGSHVN